jgi:hypothetical protein
MLRFNIHARFWPSNEKTGRAGARRATVAAMQRHGKIERFQRPLSRLRRAATAPGLAFSFRQGGKLLET